MLEPQSVLHRLTNVKQEHKESLAQQIKYELILDPTEKSHICDFILHQLPHWFGIEESIVDYINEVQQLLFLAAKINGDPIGFFAIKDHYPSTSEICVCGILPDFHRLGIGEQLLALTEKSLREKGVRYLTVKTLSESHPDPYYQRTRLFYESVGFLPIEEFKTHWDEANPCLFMLKCLQCSA